MKCVIDVSLASAFITESVGTEVLHGSAFSGYLPKAATVIYDNMHAYTKCKSVQK